MLEVRNIHKTYEKQALLNGVSFQVKSGELVCLLGSSGSGKSTLLRIIAGLEDPEEGGVYWNGAEITTLAPHLRGFGLMFQDYALFPHRSVAENVAFGLRMRKVPKEQIEERVIKALRRIRMEAFASRPVTELSGGEQQRVALARALAAEPKLLMLDEPLGALDHNLRVQLIQELREVLRESRIPVIYVTHDREEAFALADRLLVLHEGKIIQSGTPRELFDQPAQAWVASFLGLGNLLGGTVASLSPLRVQTGIGLFYARNDDADLQVGQDCQLLLRPEDARLSEAEQPGTLHVTVRDTVFLGERTRLELLAGEVALQALTEQSYPTGKELFVSWQMERVQCLRA